MTYRSMEDSLGDLETILQDNLPATLVTVASEHSTTVALPAPAKPIELRHVNVYPPGQWMVKPAERWAEEVEERTGGRVEATIFAGGAMGKGADYPDMIRKGAAEWGLVSDLLAPGQFPMTNVATLPLLIASPAVVTDAMYALYYKGLVPGLNDFKLMWIQATCPGYLFMKEKKITKLEDLKGLKIRAAGGGETELVEQWEASPVGLPSGELYMSLDRGMIDGLITMTQYVHDVKLYEVLKYIVAEPLFGGRAFVIVMSLDVWNELPPDIQVIIDRLNAEARYWCYENVRLGPEELIADGMEVIYLTPEEREKLRNLAGPIIDKWIADMEAKGLPAQEGVELAKWIATGTK